MKSAAMIYFSLALPCIVFCIERSYNHWSEIDEANQFIKQRFSHQKEPPELLVPKMPVPAVYAFWLSILYGGLGLRCLSKSQPSSAELKNFHKLLEQSKKESHSES